MPSDVVPLGFVDGYSAQTREAEADGAGGDIHSVITSPEGLGLRLMTKLRDNENEQWSLLTF